MVGKGSLVSGSWRSAAVMESVGSSLVLSTVLVHGKLIFLERFEQKHSLSCLMLWGLCCCALYDPRMSPVALCSLPMSNCMAAKGAPWVMTLCNTADLYLDQAMEPGLASI